MPIVCLRRCSARTPVALVFLLACAISCSTSLASAQMTGYSGTAYGTLLSVSPGTSNLNSGETANTSLCTETTGVTNTNSVTGVSLPPVGSTGVIDTAVSSGTVSNGTASTATANVAGISLLGGLITANTVTAVSSSIFGPGGFSTSSSGTTFTDGQVLGVPVLVNVAPNTRIILPGIGSVTLNEQVSSVTSTSASLTINMIHIRVAQTNSLGLPVGLQFIVGHAQSSTLTNEGLLSGFGYGSSVTAAGIVEAGRSAAITLPCSGTTDGAIETNDVAGVTVPGVLTTGAIHTTAQGSLTTSGASGQITASVAGLDLLSSLVTATTITADASASINGGSITLSDTGSLFVGLAVAGHPEVGANPAPNTRVSLAGLGTLWLHRIIQPSTSIQVRMVELVVDAENTYGLPVGADVRLAVADVGVIN